MQRKAARICAVPAVIWGTASDRVYLYVHGQGGSKEEGEILASIVCERGWQVVSIDLPGHGDRKDELSSFVPWKVVPELSGIMEYMKCHWAQISLYANSIGAYFSMLSFAKERFQNCLFVSPILDMKLLISNMMEWAGVSETRLEKEQVIPTSFGQTLSWEYFVYASEHPVESWAMPTKILYGEKDHLTSREVTEDFARRFGCSMTVMEKGEHWFHTPEQMEFLSKWVKMYL